MNTQVSNLLSTGRELAASPQPPAAGQVITLTGPLPESLPMDRVLNAVVGKNGAGEPGLFIKDSFVKVDLPQGIEEGTQLKIILRQGQSGITLHLLPTPGTASPGNLTLPDLSSVKDAFQKILQSLLPELSLETMKKGFQGKASLIHLLQNSGTTLSPTELKQIPQLFEKFYAARELIPQQALKNPEELTTLLKHLVAAQSKSPLSAPDRIESSTSIAETAGFQNALREVAKLLSHEITEILQHPLEVSENAKSALLEKIQQILAPFTSSVEFSMPQISRPVLDHSLIGDLFKSFLLLKNTFQSGPHSSADVIKNQIETLQKFLPLLEKSLLEGNEDEVKKVLHKLLRFTSETLPHEVTRQEQSTHTKGSTPDQPLARFLENLMQTRDQIGQLQPLMQTLGEPLFFLMPVIINGIFHNWEMKFDPAKVHNESGQKKKKGPNEFTRIHLALELPSLGPIQIDIAHRKKEILLSLKFEQEDITDFVDSALPALESVFRKAGYDQLSLITRTGTPESVRPEWFNEALEQKTIA